MKCSNANSENELYKVPTGHQGRDSPTLTGALKEGKIIIIIKIQHCHSAFWHIFSSIIRYVISMSVKVLLACLLGSDGVSKA